jgi:sensor c-di-GMP phosphodiesterase-like protein
MPLFETAGNGNLFPATSTVTTASVNSSATATTLLAANTNRRGATIYNNSTQILYINLAATVNATTNFLVALNPKAYFELPFTYTGVISGIWAAANGTANIAEFI